MNGMKSIYWEQSMNNILQIPYSVMIVRLVHPIVEQAQVQVKLVIVGLVMEYDLHVQIKMIGLL